MIHDSDESTTHLPGVETVRWWRRRGLGECYEDKGDLEDTRSLQAAIRLQRVKDDRGMGNGQLD